MSFINLNEIEIMGLNTPIKRAIEETKKNEQQKLLQTIKDNKMNKQKEKLEMEDNMMIFLQKKEKSIKKIISMANNKKDKKDIIKKIGRVIDKYYVKEHELEY